jgi:hypothetical protein
MSNQPDAAGAVDLAYRRDCDALSAALLAALVPLETRTPPVSPDAVMRMLCALLARRAVSLDLSLHALERMLRAAYADRVVRADKSPL